MAAPQALQPTRKQLQGARSRERILQAAAGLMAERGYAGTSISAVSRASGLPASSIYWHFESKDGLYEAVLESGLRPLLERMNRLAEQDRAPDAVDQLIAELMDHLGRNPHLPRLIHHEVLTGGETLGRLARGWIRPLVAQGLIELERDPHSPWDEEEFPLVLSAWIHLVFGHFALAPLIREVFDQDPLSREGLLRQTRFLRKLAGRMGPA